MNIDITMSEYFKAAETVSLYAKNNPDKGFVMCPICRSVVKYSVANNKKKHVAARCTKKGCLNFIE